MMGSAGVISHSRALTLFLRAVNGSIKTKDLARDVYQSDKRQMMSQRAMAFTQDLTGIISYSLTSNNQKTQNILQCVPSL